MGRLRMVFLVLMVSLMSVHAETEGAASEAAITPRGLMIVAGTGHSALLAQDTRFEPRLQLQSTVRAGVAIPVGRETLVAAGFAFEHANASSAEGGIIYSAWTGRSLWTRLEYVPQDTPAALRFSLSGTLMSYDSSFLLSFFPALRLGPLLRLPLSRHAAAVFWTHLEYQRRQDLVVANRSLPGTFALGASCEIELGL